MPSLVKSLPCKQGRALSNRYQVKRFKHSEDMHKFLNKQYDNNWKQIDQDIKSGTYFQQVDRNGIRWINVKELMV